MIRALIISAAVAAPVAAGACGPPPELEHADARRRLVDYYVSTSDGVYRDTARLRIELKRDGDIRYAVDSTGTVLAAFRWTGQGWAMRPSRAVTGRLKRLARDRPAVRALESKVDSAGRQVARVESWLAGGATRALPSGPRSWELGQARDFTLEMSTYLANLREEADALAGASELIERVDSLKARLTAARERIERLRSGDG